MECYLGQRGTKTLTTFKTWKVKSNIQNILCMTWEGLNKPEIALHLYLISTASTSSKRSTFTVPHEFNNFQLDIISYAPFNLQVLIQNVTLH